MSYYFRINLWFFSLLWIDNYSKSCSLYKAQCSYLKPRYLTFHQRIVDFGALDCWWNIHYKMNEFDVNVDDWPNEVENTITYKINDVFNRLSSTFS